MSKLTIDPSHPDINVAGDNGQNKAYIVLSSTERKKGFVRPLRSTYKHVGKRPKYPTRDLTSEEEARFVGEDYVAYEEYPEEKLPALGRFWTLDQLESGCGQKTTMAAPLAETYARDPGFYGATFCTRCSAHHPVEEFVWMDGEQVGS